MAPPSSLQYFSTASAPASPDHGAGEPFPSLSRSSTDSFANQIPGQANRSHLAPEDAIFASPPRRPPSFDASARDGLRTRHRLGKNGSRSRSRRRRRVWKKLLWVKQSFPDNYTDQATFLEHLQRNPRLKPYDFWPLVADSTVIVQHVCSVIIFVICFVGIFQERVSPVSVVGWGSFATFIGWLLWDWWVGQEEDGVDTTDRMAIRRPSDRGEGRSRYATPANTSMSNLPSAASSSSNLMLTAEHRSLSHPPLMSIHSNSSFTSVRPPPRHSHSASVTSLHSVASQASGAATSRGPLSPTETATPSRHRPTSPLRSSRTHLRVSTIKSAVLIYFTLLGLSPILKSLTRSTSSDSIWAMSFWLLAINIFFFDYSGTWDGMHKFPVASLSTNAALMASTVLASRLPSTGQVFSLTLFSIEVFGLFPVFRRYARHRSWRYHVVLTVLLLLGAGGGVGIILSGNGGGGWPWRGGLVGMLVSCLIAAVSMGGCSWWLIGLQKYKNEIRGPWDPARPIIISQRYLGDE